MYKPVVLLFLIIIFGCEHKPQSQEKSNKIKDTVIVANSSLDEIPDSIWDIKDGIRHLDISENNITSLPEQFCDMKSLCSVKLSNNYISKWPVCCERLTELIKIVALDYNSFQSNPDSDTPEMSISKLSRIPGLKDLTIRWRQINAIPTNINLLQKLNKLELSEGGYSYLPAELFELTTLEELNLMNNQLEGLSDSIGNMKGLTKLDISGNGLNRLPNSLTTLSKLEYLYLARNSLSVMPKDIQKLSSLKVLDLSENRFDLKEQKRIQQALPKTEILF